MTNSKKIKLVVGISDFRVGGAQKLIADLLNRIDKESFDVHLIVCMDALGQATFLDQVSKSVSVHQLSFESFKDLKSWFTLVKLLKEISPDVVLSSLYFANTVFRVCKLLVGYEVIISEQNTYVGKTFIQKVADYTLSLITFKIVAVSSYVADFTARQERISKKKFSIIYNGTDVFKLQKEASLVDRSEILNEFGLDSKNRIILNIGQFIYQKNQALLIDSFSLFSEKYPDYRLLILGDGAKRSELEKQIETLSLEGKVFLPGIKKGVARYFAASDFFVLSSRFEGFPIVVTEALACGLPIISTPVSGSSDYLKDGKNGFLVEETAESIAESMSKIASMNDQEMLLLKKTSQSIAEQFDIEKVTQLYEALFRSALK